MRHYPDPDSMRPPELRQALAYLRQGSRKLRREVRELEVRLIGARKRLAPWDRQIEELDPELKRQVLAAKRKTGQRD